VSVRRVAMAVAMATLPSLSIGAGASVQYDAPKTLRGAAFEAAPVTSISGRFRLRARLQPAPTPSGPQSIDALKIDATLVPASKALACAVPGRIFSDGYETP
jgi:hypothetical protein